jgi:hypothetical protein
LVRSATIDPTSAGQSTTSVFPPRRTSVAIVLATESTSAGTSKLSHSSRILPASIFDTSRMSLMSCSRCAAAWWIRPASAVVAAHPDSSCNSSL